jgi:hypothetical protein
MKTRTYDIIREEFTRIIKENVLESEQVDVKAAPLSAEEAIGNPEDRDYPLLAGVERLMQAEFKGCWGQAFTDMYGNFNDRLADIVTIGLTNDFRRTIFISSLNAVMRYLGLITNTIHCKNNEPWECSYHLVKYIERNYGHPKVAFVGFQPRMIEALSNKLDIKVTDMDQNNIGTEKFGITIHSPEKTSENLEWCDIALVTGTAVVNDTIDRFMIDRPVIFYGITIAGVAKLLSLNHFCYSGHRGQLKPTNIVKRGEDEINRVGGSHKGWGRGSQWGGPQAISCPF